MATLSIRQPCDFMANRLQIKSLMSVIKGISPNNKLIYQKDNASLEMYAHSRSSDSETKPSRTKGRDNPKFQLTILTFFL